MWELNSRDGWQTMEWKVQEAQLCNTHTSVIASLRLSGRFWDPVRLSVDNEYILTSQYQCELPSILLSLEKIDMLILNLSNWFREYASVDVNLSLNEYQCVSFHLGVVNDLTCSRVAPICTIKYLASRALLQWRLPVDESCLQAFAQQVVDWRERRGHPASL